MKVIDIDLYDLPDNPTVNALRQLLGDDLLAQLSMDLGGSAVSVPHRVGEHSVLAVSVGLEAAQKIAAVYGGTNIEIPTTIGRTAAILRLRQEGLSVNAIARKLHITRRQIQRILEKAGKAHQKDLFSKG